MHRNIYCLYTRQIQNKNKYAFDNNKYFRFHLFSFLFFCCTSRKCNYILGKSFYCIVHTTVGLEIEVIYRFWRINEWCNGIVYDMIIKFIFFFNNNTLFPKIVTGYASTMHYSLLFLQYRFFHNKFLVLKNLSCL